MRRAALVTLALLASPALADTDTFYGWSKDGTYFVYHFVNCNDVARSLAKFDLLAVADQLD